jgi:hypothetical protein
VRKRDREAVQLSSYHQAAITWRLPYRLVPRLLFGLALLISAGLLGLVLLAPLLERSGLGRGEGARLLAVFAHDATLRRTAIAVAMGLSATACIFFRHPFGAPYHRLPRVPPPRRDHGF